MVKHRRWKEEVEEESEPSEPVSADVKTVLGVLEGGDPNAKLALFRVLLEELKHIHTYFQDNMILLDMQELKIHLRQCGASTASTRISRISKSQSGILGISKSQNGNLKISKMTH
jgi:hypothetical protein